MNSIYLHLSNIYILYVNAFIKYKYFQMSFLSISCMNTIINSSLFFLNLIQMFEWYHCLHKNDNNEKCFLSTLEWFLEDYVTLKRLFVNNNI